MNRSARAAAWLALLSIFPSGSALAAGLGGSPASMRMQYEIALKNDFTFLKTPAQVEEFVRKERLEPVESNENVLVNNVSFPYARPAVALFVQRLAEQYRAATGDRLVVTSLTRPTSRQPRNAHKLSVHPTGMAVDLRIPADEKARAWLESVLLQLEARGVLDATREKSPPHYHVAVFPEKYETYVASLPKDTTPTVAQQSAASLEPLAEGHGHDEDVPHPMPAPVGAGPAVLGIAGFSGILAVGLVRRRSRRRTPRA